jgi:enamine deaminase RidA (YjgF/YER057c/UK114 family)
MSGTDARLRGFPGQASSPGARPAGLYASFSQVGDMLYSSSVVGREDSQVITGPLIGPDCVPRGKRAAGAAVIAILHAAQEELGSLDRVVKVVALTGNLNLAQGFNDHIQVMNAASAVIAQILPDAPLPARTTVGVAALPSRGAVEISMLIQITPAQA